MDSFSVLSDELLIKILSFLPTKVAVSTSVLSKRWEYLWMWLPKLKFGRRFSSSSECQRLQSFLNRNLPLHRAPVIESLHLELITLHFKPDNVKMWILVAISHCVRSLEVDYYYCPDQSDVLPISLYTCKSLVILKLDGDILLDVPPMVFLPSLKTLHLNGVTCLTEESLRLLLSNCPILEDLVVGILEVNNMRELTVVAPPSLQSLSIEIIYFNVEGGGIVMKTPSLKYFKLVDYGWKNHYCLIENMPNLIEAYLDVKIPNIISSLIGSLTSVKHLVICSEAIYDEGFVFNNLRHLKICKCNKHFSDLLVRLLNYSPNLQVLDIFVMHGHFQSESVDWKQPSTIPECILSSLQTLNWDGYTGEPGERDLAVYILKTASHLRTTTFKLNASHLRTTTFKSDESEIPKSEMIKELALSSRASTTCQFVFD